MIINDEKVIFKILEQYEGNLDEAQLKQNILELLRPIGNQLINQLYFVLKFNVNMISYYIYILSQ